MDRNDILRKISSMKAKAADPAITEAERETCLKIMNKWMQEYNVTLTEAELKEEEVGASRFDVPGQKGKAQVHEMHWVVVAIAKLTDTRVISSQNKEAYIFMGTLPDREYAEFLFRLCFNAIEQSWTAYRYSYDYVSKVNKGTHGRKIRTAYRKTMAFRLYERLEEMAKANIIPGKGLVVCKNALIDAAYGNAGKKTKKGSGLVLYDSTRDVRASAYEEANKVQLRKNFANGADQLLLGVK